MAIFNFDVEQNDFRYEQISTTSTECATLFEYRIYAPSGNDLLIDFNNNIENAVVTLNSSVIAFTSGQTITFTGSLFISFSVQNSGIPGTFNSGIIDISDEDTGEDIQISVQRNSDSPRCENLQYTFDGLTDTPEEKDGQAGRYIRVNQAEDALEYHDISDEITFASNLADDLEIPNEWEENPEGITIGQLQGLTPTQLIETLFFPDVPASISVNASLSVSGVTTGTYEVGTTIVQNYNVNLNRGTILNGDQSVAGTVVGDLATVTVLNPDGGTGYSNGSASGTTDNAITSGYVITQGTNTWVTSATNVAGTTTYTNNKGDASTVASIESAKADTTQGPINTNLSGAYRRFHYVGTENNSPTTSTPIRSLTNSLLSTSSTGTWNVSIGAGASNAEFSFYIPQGKSISVIDLGNLNLDITADFVATNLTVNDANGDAVNYTKYTRFAGTLGYTNPTTFRITVS